MTWAIYFFEAFLIGIIVGLIVLRIKSCIKNNLIKRWGGVIIITSIILTILINPELEITRQIGAVLMGGILILIFGTWDDLRNLSWKAQLLFQLFLAIFLVYFGFEVNHLKLFDGFVLDFNVYLIGAFFFIIWFIAVVNSINWLDGIDGLSGSVSILAILAILLVSFRPEVNQPAIIIISLIAIGSIISFLIFNFSSTLIAGTSGSYFLGFILASLAVIAGTKIATVMLVIAFPLVDAFWVIFDRIKSRKSIFTGDRDRHFHFQLIKRGWSKNKIVFSYVSFLAIILVVDYFLEERNLKLIFLFFEIIVIIFMMYFVRKSNLYKK